MTSFVNHRGLQNKNKRFGCSRKNTCTMSATTFSLDCTLLTPSSSTRYTLRVHNGAIWRGVGYSNYDTSRSRRLLLWLCVSLYPTASGYRCVDNALSGPTIASHRSDLEDGSWTRETRKLKWVSDDSQILPFLSFFFFIVCLLGGSPLRLLVVKLRFHDPFHYRVPKSSSRRTNRPGFRRSRNYRSSTITGKTGNFSIS